MQFMNLLMMNKHVWDMLTELWPLLVLHDWKAMAAGNKTHGLCYAVKVMVNTFQDVSMIEQNVLYYIAEGAELNHQKKHHL